MNQATTRETTRQINRESTNQPASGSLPLFSMATTKRIWEPTNLFGWLVPDEPIGMMDSKACKHPSRNSSSSYPSQNVIRAGTTRGK
uniref:Uncharacterized protein n=1 Tax=Romanomermis culicivorax TaxID=13658 RepID=A0A915K9Z3_ROMCU